MVVSHPLYWTWYDGSSSVNMPANYSVFGVHSATVHPGGRSLHDAVIHPNTGSFVLFGGYVYRKKSPGYSNELWEYNFDLKQWRWLYGNDTSRVGAIYGIKGESSASNNPGSRGHHKIDISEKTGKLFLFGGFLLNQYYNDLWEYDFDENTWTWISGNNKGMQAGSYGRLGQSSSDNVPGSRIGHSMNIHQGSDEIIVFGGFGLSNSTNMGYLNDLWSYDATTGMWTWLSGSANTVQSLTYNNTEIVGTFAQPKSRYLHSSSIDMTNNNLLIHGGINLRKFNYPSFETSDELWSFNFETKQWALLSGNSSTDDSTVYDQMGSYPKNSDPLSRYSHQITFVPHLNSIIMFGGTRMYLGTYTSGNTTYSYASQDYSNEVWIFSMDSNQWTLLGGAWNQHGNYGAKGVTNVTNVPGSRQGHSFKYSKFTKNCVLFGGHGAGLNSLGYLNDMWLIDLPNVQTPSTTVPDTTETAHHSTYSSFDKVFSIFDVTQDEPNSFHTIQTNTTQASSVSQLESSTFIQILQKFEMLFIVGISIFIVILFALLIFVRRRRKKLSKPANIEEKHHDTTDPYDEMTTNSIASSMSSSYSTSMYSASVATVMGKPGLSLPGFLCFKDWYDYRIGKEIARTGMATVYLASVSRVPLNTYGQTIIVKQIRNSNMGPKEINMFHQEISIMYYLRDHKNIAKFLGYSEHPFCILIKYYSNGSLQKWLQIPQNRKRTKARIFSFITDIARGLDCIHHADFAHCDLKPHNVLIDWDPVTFKLFAVLTDFGITQVVSSESLLVKAFHVVQFRGASILYASPEAIMRVRSNYDIGGRDLFKLDIYSFGIILYEMITLKRPWTKRQ